MKTTKPNQENLTPYRTWGLTLLQLMGLLALAGIAVEVVLRYLL